MTEIELFMDGNDRVHVSVHADQEYEITGTITGVARDGQFFSLIGQFDTEESNNGSNNEN